MTPAQPFALPLFVPSGMPEGKRIVEKSNGSGIGSQGRMPAGSPCASTVKDS
ncbi:MAG: hypothetical protein ACK5QQ_07205 [Cyanobacteriota bacterium]